MKKNFRKFVVPALCCLFLLVATFICFSVENIVHADVEWGVVSNSEDIKPNEKLPVAFLNRKVSINGTETDYDRINVIYPDGKAVTFERGEEPVLNMAGKYTIVYIKEINGKVYSAEEILYVKSKSVSTGTNTTAVYDKGDKAINETSKGILLNLARNEEVTFNNLIDVTDMRASSINNEPLVSLYFNPNNAGTNDVGSFWIELIDSFDSEKKLRIQISYTRERWTVVKGGGENQVLTGLEGTSNYHRGDEFGTYTYSSLAALDLNRMATNSDFAILSVYFDSAENCLKIQDSKEKAWNPTLKTVADFDSKDFFPSELWTGFPSGKVRMKMYGSDWVSPNAQVCVTSLYGCSDLNAYLSNELNDAEAPEIKIDVDEKYRNNMPEARLGDYYYSIPDASAFDLYSGSCDVKVSVVYDSMLSCEIHDGKFKTDKVGLYTIRYCSTDNCGNEKIEELYVHCGREIADINVSFENVVSSVYCGELLELPNPVIEGGSGTLSYSVSVYDSLGEEYVATDGFVRAKNKGILTLFYTITEDFTGYEQVDTVKTEVVDAGKAFLAENVVLPKYFISGAKYKLPEYKAFVYNNGVLMEKTVDMYMNGQKYVALSEYIPVVSENGGLTELTYKCGDDVVYTASVPTITAYNEYGELFTENYFVTKRGSYTVKKEMSGIGFISSLGYEVEFAKALSLTNFSVTMLSETGKAKFDEIEFTLTDSENASQSISFSVIRKRKYYFFVEGATIELSQDFDNGNDLLKISYVDGTLKYGAYSVRFTKYNDGTSFKGFSSSNVYLTINVGSSESNTLKISEINSYNFNDAITDLTAPTIFLESKVTGYKDVNQVVTIGKASAYDVLDPNVSLFVSVRTPSGEYVTSVDDMLLKNADGSRNYEIKLAEYGQYVVTYVAYDGKGNAARISYAISVKDVNPPRITFEKGFKLSGKIGESYVIPDYTVIDDVSSTDKVVSGIYVLTPFDRFEAITDKTYVFRAAGEYTIYIFAYDEEYNYVFYTVTVNVTK